MNLRVFCRKFVFMNIHPAVTVETRDYCAWQECISSFVTGSPGFNCWTRRFPLTPAQVCGVLPLSKGFKIVCLFLSVYLCSYLLN